MATLEFELRTLEKSTKEQASKDSMSKKMLELMGTIEELKNAIIKKNIKIENLKYHKVQEESDDSGEEDIKKMGKNMKIEFLNEQLEISNKLILRKNIEILNISKKTLKY